MKPGDLCRLVGTYLWGEFCIVLEVENGLCRVLKQDGKTGTLSSKFLEIIGTENAGEDVKNESR